MDQEDANGNLTLICQRKMLDHAVFKDRGNSIIAGRAIKEDEQGSVAAGRPFIIPFTAFYLHFTVHAFADMLFSINRDRIRRNTSKDIFIRAI